MDLHILAELSIVRVKKYPLAHVSHNELEHVKQFEILVQNTQVTLPLLSVINA